MDGERIGKIIKEIRQKNHQTQKEFAEKYNVSFQAVSKWENGKSIPDITLLKQICNENHMSIDELLNNKSTPKKRKGIILFISVLLILVVILAIILMVNLNENSTFEFKKISTTCPSFKITGSAAYNKEKTSIYISNIEFCGEEEDIEYKKIEYALFESNNDTNTKISSGKVEEDITLIEYLKNLKINVNDYSQTCESFSQAQLYIEINATDNKDKIITYNIPISLEENCNE